MRFVSLAIAFFAATTAAIAGPEAAPNADGSLQLRSALRQECKLSSVSNTPKCRTCDGSVCGAWYDGWRSLESRSTPDLEARAVWQDCKLSSVSDTRKCRSCDGSVCGPWYNVKKSVEARSTSDIEAREVRQECKDAIVSGTKKCRTCHDNVCGTWFDVPQSLQSRSTKIEAREVRQECKNAIISDTKKCRDCHNDVCGMWYDVPRSLKSRSTEIEAREVRQECEMSGVGNIRRCRTCDGNVCGGWFYDGWKSVAARSAPLETPEVDARGTHIEAREVHEECEQSGVGNFQRCRTCDGNVCGGWFYSGWKSIARRGTPMTAKVEARNTAKVETRDTKAFAARATREDCEMSGVSNIKRCRQCDGNVCGGWFYSW